MPDLARGLIARRHRLDRAAEADLVGDFGPLELPGIAERQPVLRHLDLPAVAEDLAEQAVVIADAIAEAGDADGRHALQEAGGEPAEAAIAERGVRLELLDARRVDAELGQRRPAGLDKPRLERTRSAAGRSGTPSRGNRPASGRRVDLPGGLDPAGDRLVARGERGRDQPVVVGRMARVLADREVSLPRIAS